MKDFKIELAELGAQREAASETRKEIIVCEENAANCQEEFDQNRDRLERIENKVN